MLNTPPPGFDVGAPNRQNVQLLGKPGTAGVGQPAPALSQFGAINSNMGQNPLSNANLPPQIKYLLSALQGRR